MKYKPGVMEFIIIICIPNLQMAKRGPMDMFIKPRHPVAENTNNSEADELKPKCCRQKEFVLALLGNMTPRTLNSVL